MKHFFDRQQPLDATDKAELLIAAKKELKTQPMVLSEMSSKVDLICINASAQKEYIPMGMENLIQPRSFVTRQSADAETAKEILKLTHSGQGTLLGYVLANIQIKNVENYIDLIFQLNMNYELEPFIVTHFSDEELIDYLAIFLNTSSADGVARQLEIFDEDTSKPWKTITQPGDLVTVERGERPPGLFDRPFFNEIHLKITQGGPTKTFGYAWGKLRTVLGHFNKKRKPSGMIHRSKNTLYLKWSDIAGIKLASAQSKTLLGVSVHGEFIPTQQFMGKNIGLNLLKPEDIDFFRMKVGQKAQDLKMAEITEIEINMDTQQILFIRGVGKSDYHISRFKSIQLTKGDKVQKIHRVVPFNRGESNFESIQTFFASRYTEYEKLKQIRSSRAEFNFLKEKNVVTGDLTAQLVLSAMNMLGNLPLAPECVGFSPDDVKNLRKMNQLIGDWCDALGEDFKSIIDVSKTPQFTKQNIGLKTKAIHQFLSLASHHEAPEDIFDRILKELEELTQYMDDFFKLNIYNRYQDEMAVEQDPSSGGLDDLETGDNSHLDRDSVDFIRQNFDFFKKRDLVQLALLKVERLRFYIREVKPYAEDPDFEPELIVYATSKALVPNYQAASYPAVALDLLLNTDSFHSDTEDEELQFIQFMRGFTKKVHTKSQELNKSFHHQYKHTLAELTFHAQEKETHLKEELAFLENPDNREQVYTDLLNKIKAIYDKQVQAKVEHIEGLRQEMKEIRDQYETYYAELQKLLGEAIGRDELDQALAQMPDRLAKMRTAILNEHNQKRKEVVEVLNSYTAVRSAIFQYFNRVLGHAALFQKALWVHKKMQLAQELMTTAKKFFGMAPDELEKQITRFGKFRYDPSQELAHKKAIEEEAGNLKKFLEELQKIKVAGLFQDKEKEKGDVLEYLKYYQGEMRRFAQWVNKLQSFYKQLRVLENALFKSQGELTSVRIEAEKQRLMAGMAELIFNNPSGKKEVMDLIRPNEEVPKEIKQELNDLRAKMNDSLAAFKTSTTEHNLTQLIDFKDLLTKAAKRDRINVVAKDLVNFSQGLHAISQEVEMEEKDLEYLKSKEGDLEKVAMSKALPSTRILLKTQYIPLVEREIKMLNRSDKFLSDIISRDKEIKEGLIGTYFRRRHGFPQFAAGVYCVDTIRGAKNHTEKNINMAMQLLAERYPKGLSPVKELVPKIGLKKVDSVGFDGVKGRITQSWAGGVTDRVIYLPTSLTLTEVLDLCEAKEAIVKETPQNSRSRNSIVLVYIQEIPWAELHKDEQLLERYHRAILSNIFIDVDGIQIYNNRESIYEACVRSTFGSCNDSMSRQIADSLLHS